jgi:endogenous inhibitor of DNA gyrase (YacG/DUF329 family)
MLRARWRTRKGSLRGNDLGGWAERSRRNKDEDEDKDEDQEQDYE